MNNELTLINKHEMKDLNYYKNNAEENYITTPISVLRYITELEKEVGNKQLDLCGVGKSFTAKQIVELLEEEETLDDAKLFFKLQE